MTNLHLYQPILSIPIQPHDRLKIFTLNYDGLIEILCEKNGKNYSDGFRNTGVPANFNDTDVQLFELDGSLFWIYTSDAKHLKVPLKGLDLSTKRCLSDDELYEMVIYLR
jgi:hypothetical protein